MLCDPGSRLCGCCGKTCVWSLSNLPWYSTCSYSRRPETATPHRGADCQVPSIGNRHAGVISSAERPSGIQGQVVYQISRWRLTGPTASRAQRTAIGCLSGQRQTLSLNTDSHPCAILHAISYSRPQICALTIILRLPTIPRPPRHSAEPLRDPHSDLVQPSSLPNLRNASSAPFCWELRLSCTIPRLLPTHAPCIRCSLMAIHSILSHPLAAS